MLTGADRKDTEEVKMKPRVLVVGAGPGGYTAAVRGAQLGGDVTLVEREHLGGTCLNWGCIPSKILQTTAAMLEKLQQAEEFGISAAGPLRVDMARLMARKEKIVAQQRKGIQGLLERHGVHCRYGEAFPKGPNRVALRTADGGGEEIVCDRLILATGTRPAAPPGFAFDGVTVISSDDALGLEEVPAEMTILGGGVTGCEFACIFNALGTRVTIVEALERLLPLPSVDPDCSKVLQREMKKRGIACLTGATVAEFAVQDGRAEITVRPSASSLDPGAVPRQLTADKFLVCTGRRPRQAPCELDLRTDDRGWIAVDERMQTGVEGVYAVGDVLGPEKVMLAHVATAEGIVAAENALGEKRVMDYRVVPAAVFTLPEVACVGLTEDQARTAGLAVRTDTVLMRTVGKAQVIGEIAGQAKIVSEITGGRIVGVHLIGSHAAELIAEAALAVGMEASVQDVADTIHAHPALNEALQEVCRKAAGRPLHG